MAVAATGKVASPLAIEFTRIVRRKPGRVRRLRRIGGRSMPGRPPAQRLLEDSFLLGARAKNRADLGAVHFGLGSGLYRAFDFAADLIELAAEVVERSPILELGDQQDIWVVRSTRLDHDDTIARNDSGLLGRFLLFLVGGRKPMHVVVEMAIDRADGRDIDHRPVVPVPTISVYGGRQRCRSNERCGAADNLN